MEIKIYKENEKLDEAYQRLVEKINEISNKYKLSYFELFGIVECYKCDLIKQNIEEDERD